MAWTLKNVEVPEVTAETISVQVGQNGYTYIIGELTDMVTGNYDAMQPLKCLLASRLAAFGVALTDQIGIKEAIESAPFDLPG